jgi:hypothetical protein
LRLKTAITREQARENYFVKAPFIAALIAFMSFGIRGTTALETKENDPVVAKAQAQMEEFAEELATLRCNEYILQQKLSPNGKVQYGQETLYDSFMMIRFEEGKIQVFEQRLEQQMPHHPIFKPLATTNGFSTLAILFHPYYAPSFRFSRLDDDVFNGRQLARIQFEHIPGTPSPAVYQKMMGDQPIEFSGTAWIDPATGRIHQIEAGAGSSLKEMGLKDLRAKLTYGEITLDEETDPRWLPVSAVVDLETPRQHWRNIHRFMDYRKYRVTVKLAEGGQQ